MRLNVRLHNMLRSSIPTVGLARPLESRVQMFYLTEEPKYTLDAVSGRRSCFFSRNLMGKTVMTSAITGNAGIEYGRRGMSSGSNCGKMKGQNVEY